MIKTNRKLVSSLLILAATVSSKGASAHHGVNAQFDLGTELTLSGRVTDIRMVNPHAYVYLEVVNAQGEVEAWNCEMSGGSLLRRNGWSADMFPTGAAIQVTGNPARRDDKGCYVQQIVLADGTLLTNDDVIRAPVENVETTLAGGVANLNGNWVALREPRPAQANGGGQRGGGRPAQGDGERPAREGGERPPQGGGERAARGGGGRGGSQFLQSEAGIAASAGFDRLDNPRLNCKSTNILLDWTFNEAVNSIVQTDKRITLNYGYMEMISRTIHLDMDEHPKDLIPSIAGHSIGKWEEGTLVVDTLGFAEGYLSANFNGVKHSESMHVVERFSLSEDGNTLNRTYVVNDPLYLTAPYEGSDSVVRTAFPFEEYDCEDLTK